MSTDFRQVAREKAKKYGLLPQVFERQIEAESGFNPQAVSHAGARGIAQIMPATARGWGVNPDDPVAALDAAAKNMAAYTKTFLGGKSPGEETDPIKLRQATEKALRAYNAGPGAVEASRKYAETNAYVNKIIGPDKFSFTQALGAPQDSPALAEESGGVNLKEIAKGVAENIPKMTPNDLLGDFILRRRKANALPEPQSLIDPVGLLQTAYRAQPLMSEEDL